MPRRLHTSQASRASAFAWQAYARSRSGLSSIAARSGHTDFTRAPEFEALRHLREFDEPLLPTIPHALRQRAAIASTSSPLRSPSSGLARYRSRGWRVLQGDCCSSGPSRARDAQAQGLPRLADCAGAPPRRSPTPLLWCDRSGRTRGAMRPMLSPRSRPCPALPSTCRICPAHRRRTSNSSNPCARCLDDSISQRSLSSSFLRTPYYRRRFFRHAVFARAHASNRPDARQTTMCWNSTHR